ncbi:DnaJ domain-containing protein [Desulfuribacillus alkaliarsenatis]|uniref:J domain-containing protein n=1 Tax=Desulfuribacillus alkaliarsenatis TaxID=766136 RepID=A0A1E5G177_9FIRM|nr:DnaJ domain-containing protein [Desulfuribacillus alkaliarsenatis]OEF96584.1 hypothetical protein BHF68_08025 [Desulfuribacillus alkaliarsenatis]
MNSAWEDYYKILQVHFLAEPEMINNAYRKLSKKYHPDLNKSYNAESKMKEIIRAYEILSDPTRRQQYFMKWVEKNSRLHSSSYQNNNRCYHSNVEREQIKGVLLDYLHCISKKEYHTAFDMLSERDQQYIAKQDFIKWQQLVSEVYELLRYDCEVQDIYRGLNMNNSTYEMVADLEVKVIEKNHIMGRKEKDELSKNIVYENNDWSVYLGRNDLTAIINRFKELASLKKRNRTYMFKAKRNLFLEEIPGVINKRAFVERARLEQIRYNRYGNVFSVVVCEVIRRKSDDNAIIVRKKNDEDEIYKQIGIVIADNLRHLDCISRWNGNGYIILLPETEGSAAIKAVDKINKKIDELFACSQEFRNNYTMKFSIAEQTYRTFKELYQSLAKK